MAQLKILIDGDSCNKISISENIAAKYDIECHIYCDNTRNITSNYSALHILDKGCDYTDFAIINACCKNDVIITSDSGLAAIAIAKKCRVLNPKGFIYTQDNIMSFLTRRFLRTDAKKRTRGRNQLHGFYSTCNTSVKFTDYRTLLIRSITNHSVKQRRKK